MPTPLPIPQIGYTVNGLEVQFTSLSLNVTDTSTYAWDFGDGVTSSDQNPLHTFTSEAFYSVTLTVTNDEPTSVTNIVNLTSTTNPNLFNNLHNLIDFYTPTTIVGSATNNSKKDFFIAKWQNYLQPLVIEPEVTPDNMYNVSAWGNLANSLIAKLVVIDIIESTASSFLLNSASEGSSSSTIIENGGTTSSSSGGIKSIETGPTKVERYENKDASSNSEKISNLAKAYQNLLVEGGPLDQLKTSACQDSQRIMVYLPMCGPLPKKNKGFSVVKPKKNSCLNSNPFGITNRMT